MVSQTSDEFIIRSQKLVGEFAGLVRWEDRYKKIISLGKELPPLDKKYKIEDLKIKGCQSQVWLHAELVDGKVFFAADSDALIVRGIIALLLRIYSGLAPEKILSSQPDFLNHLELAQHLSPSRANGLVAMIKQIRNYALAFQHLQTTKKV